MEKVKIVYWKEEETWLGYLQEYPDYWTQGETLEDLKEHLRDLCQEIVGGEIPGIRRWANWTWRETGRADQVDRKARRATQDMTSPVAFAPAL
jgi:hypothetical protein